MINNCSNTFVTKYFHLLRLIRSYLNWNHWAAAERHTSLICWCLKVLPTSLISSSWSESVKISENYYFPGWDRHRKMKVESEISRWRSKSIDLGETLTFDTKESNLIKRSKSRVQQFFSTFSTFQDFLCDTKAMKISFQPEKLISPVLADLYNIYFLVSHIKNISGWSLSSPYLRVNLKCLNGWWCEWTPMWPSQLQSTPVPGVAGRMSSGAGACSGRATLQLRINTRTEQTCYTSSQHTMNSLQCWVI